jgi:ubiquinol-cytochrome c reductase cytochrome c subunit
MTEHRSARFPFVVFILLLVAAGFTVLGTVDTVAAQTDQDSELISEGAAVYASKCASCHQPAGEGVPGAFPPLLANPRVADSDYVGAVVRDGLSGELEVDGVIYNETMPAADLSDSEAEAVVAYVATLATRDVSTPDTTVAPTRAADASIGKKLFRGSSSFTNNGAACSACHSAGSIGNLGGPTLGPDLTNSLATFGGEAGMSAWLRNPSSKTMIPIFERHELTGEEIADVAAFLATAPSQTRTSYYGDALVYSGIAGLIVLLGSMAIAWRGMRQTYVQKLSGARK